MKELVLSIDQLLNVCRMENVRSARSMSSGALLPVLLWCYNAKHVLEIGTLEGFTALAIGMQLELMGKDKELVICDVCGNWVKHSIRLLEKHAPSVKVSSVIGDSTKISWANYLALPRRHRFNFVYIDGDHSKEGVAGDLEQIAPWVSERGGILLHDYVDLAGYGVIAAVNEFVERNDGWSFVPIPAMFGSPMALLCRSMPCGLPMGKRRRFNGV